MSTFVLTVDVRDLEPTGPVPASAEVRLWRAVPDASGPQVVSTRQQTLNAGTGPVTVTLTAGVVYWAEFTGVRGWETPFLFSGTADTSIAERWLNGRIDPTSLQPVTAAPTVAAQIAALQTQIAGLGGGGGTGNDPAFQYTQASPSAQWTISHAFGRRPDVDVYLTTGEHVITDVTASSTQVVVTFPTPTAGYAVLT